MTEEERGDEEERQRRQRELYGAYERDPERRDVARADQAAQLAQAWADA